MIIPADTVHTQGDCKMMTELYFVIKGTEPFDIHNPDWKRVKVLTLWGRLDAAGKQVVYNALTNGVSIDSMNPEARESVGQFVAGGNY